MTRFLQIRCRRISTENICCHTDAQHPPSSYPIIGNWSRIAQPVIHDIVFQEVNDHSTLWRRPVVSSQSWSKRWFERSMDCPSHPIHLSTSLAVTAGLPGTFMVAMRPQKELPLD